MRHLIAAAILVAAASAAQAGPVRLDAGNLDAVTAAGAQQAAVWKAETTRTVINGREVEQTVIRRLSEVKGKTVEKVVIVIDGRLVQGNRKVHRQYKRWLRKARLPIVIDIPPLPALPQVPALPVELSLPLKIRIDH